MKTKILAFRLLVLVLVCSLGVGFSTAQALEVKLSGQINRAIMWADNGDESDVMHVDNDNSSTRYRLVGAEQVSEKVKVGVVWETEFESNTSSGVDIDDNSDNESEFKERKLEAFFEGPFGKFSIGQGDGAANGTSESDLSGTSVIMYSGVTDTSSSLTFRDDDGIVITTVGSTRTNLDGLSRNDRLRYDTPKFSGFTFSTSATNGDAWEVALRYAADYGDVGKVAAAIGHVYSNERDPTEFSQTGASISWLHSSGFNLTLAYGMRDVHRSDNDPVNYYVKAGYKRGKHAFAVEYGMTEDLAVEDDESSNIGVAYVITPWNGVEFYGTFRQFELDREGVSDIEDLRQVMVGTRVKF